MYCTNTDRYVSDQLSTRFSFNNKKSRYPYNLDIKRHPRNTIKHQGRGH